MNKKNFKFIISVATLITAVSLLVMGVYAIGLRSIDVYGTVSFTAQNVKANISVISGYGNNFDLTNFVFLKDNIEVDTEYFESILFHDTESNLAGGEVNNVDAELGDDNYIWSYIVVVDNLFLTYDELTDTVIPGESSIWVEVNFPLMSYPFVSLTSSNDVFTFKELELDELGETGTPTYFEAEDDVEIPAGGMGYWLFSYEINPDLAPAIVDFDINSSFQLIRSNSGVEPVQPEQTAVAKIGETEFNTIEDAIYNANDGDILYLLNDIEIQEPISIGDLEGSNPISLTIIPFDKNVTLTRSEGFTEEMFFVEIDSTFTIGSLNSYSIIFDSMQTESFAMISNFGTLNINDRVIIKNFYSQYGEGAISNFEHSILNINGENTNFTNNCAIYGAAITNYGGTVNIIKANFYNNVSPTGNGIIYNKQGWNCEPATMNISGGTFTNNQSLYGLLYNLNAELNITGGVFEDNSGQFASTIYSKYDNQIANQNFFSILRIRGGTFNRGASIEEQIEIGENVYNCFICLYMFSFSSDYGSKLILSGDPELNNVGYICLSNEAGSHGTDFAPIEIDGEFTSDSNFNLRVGSSSMNGSGLVKYTYETPATNNGNKFYLLSPNNYELYFDDNIINYRQNYVAKIGETEFNTIEDAIYYANNGDILYLLNDIEIQESISIGDVEGLNPISLTIRPFDKNVTLTRSEGFTEQMFFVEKNSTLTIGSSNSYSIIFDSMETESASMICNLGTLNINDGVIIKNFYSQDGFGAISNCEDSTLYINGENTNFTNNCAMYGSAIANFGGTVNIIKANFYDNVSPYGNGIIYNKQGNYEPATMNISGGTFTDNQSWLGLLYNLNAELNITGGFFEDNSGQFASTIYSEYDRDIANQNFFSILRIRGGTFNRGASIEEQIEIGENVYNCFICLYMFSFSSDYGSKLILSGNPELNNVGYIFLRNQSGSHGTDFAPIEIDAAFNSDSNFNLRVGSSMNQFGLVKYTYETPATNNGDKFYLLYFNDEVLSFNNEVLYFDEDKNIINYYR